MRKKIFITLIGITIITLIILLVQKISIINKYKINNYDKQYNKFIELYKNKTELTITNKDITEELIEFNDLSIPNILGTYEVVEESLIHKSLKNSKTNILITYTNESICKILNDDSNIDERCNSKEIFGFLDYFEYIYNYDEKVNIISSKNEIIKDYELKMLLNNINFDYSEQLITVNGNNDMVILKGDKSIEIFVNNKEKRYTISLNNIELNNQQLTNFLSGIKISN